MAAAAGGGSASSFVFENPSIYDSFNETKEADSEIPVIHLPVGAKVFRADREGSTEPSTNVPAFFGNKITIAPYAKPFPGKTAKPESETHSAFIVKKSPRLFHMTLNTLIQLGGMMERKLDIAESEDEEEFFKYALETLGLYFNFEAGCVIPSLPIEPSKWSKGDKKFRHYLNRAMAEIVCRLGFDGWMVKPFDPEKKQGMLQVSIMKLKEISDKTKIPIPILLEHTVALQGASVEYPPEVMLCNWKEFMEPASMSGGRRSRRTRRQRRTRRHR